MNGAGALAQDAFYALMGCKTPLDGANRGCSGDATLVHINVEAWRLGYADTFDKIQAQYPEAPKVVGPMGSLEEIHHLLFSFFFFFLRFEFFQRLFFFPLFLVSFCLVMK